ncbi:MAG: metallophosphoesterase [Ignavibacteria bacterium]|nr:metallophosphoesterase [Ignavibacteria bacterium]
MKRILIISDLHCGNRFGLTPPPWQYKEREGYYHKIGAFQRSLWTWYSSMIDKIKSEKPIDVLVCNGDAIDGKGERSGGTELLEADRNEQIKIAKTCIEQAAAKKIIIVNGTPYHTGKEDDFEATLAALLNAQYANHCHINVDGVRFDIRHKVNSSVIPHGRYTAPRREAVWSAMWGERGLSEKADFIIRSHVHYFTLSEDAATTVITTPSLQGWTKYGSRECSGIVDLGFLVIDCDKGNAATSKYFFDMKEFKVEFLEI